MGKTLLALLLIYLVKAELLQVVTVFRHGSRYPLQKTYDWQQTKQDHGELTSTGMRQHYNLGSAIRKQYITNNPFLMSSYNHSEIEITSTDYNRTQMSANSFLFGLYPELTGPKIPPTINKSCLLPPYAGRTDDISENTYTLPHGRQIINIKQDGGSLYIDCPKQQDKNKNDNHAVIQQMDTRYAPFMKNMTKLFNQTYPFTILNMSKLYDTLVCDKYLNRDLPPSFTEANYVNMRHIHEFANQIKYSNDFANAVNTPKFRKIFSNFDKVISNPKQLFKMSIMSCHDTDIIPLQAQLNISSSSCIEQLYRFNKTDALNCQPGPQFAASMIFELHKNGSDYNVMIKSNGKYINLCDKKSTSCLYNEFKTRVQKDYRSQSIC